MPRFEGDPEKVIISETFDDAKAFKAANPEYAEYSCVSVRTLSYRMKGRTLREFVLTDSVKALPQAGAIEQSARLIVALYGIADNTGDLAAHYAYLDEVLKTPNPTSAA